MFPISRIVRSFPKNWNRTFTVVIQPKERTFFSATSPQKEVEKKVAFNFNNYDCIGFDLDNTLARYKIGNMLEMEYKIVCNYLIKEKNLPTDMLLKPIDPNFLIKGLIVDDENGNLIRIAPDGRILQATHGTRWLTEKEILEYYPTRHWKATDLFIEDPLQTWNGPYSEKMRTLLDYFDIVVGLAFARSVDTIDKYNGPKKEYNIWPTLFNALMYMFNREHFEQDLGEYFPEMKKNPHQYYYKCSENVEKWLRELKKRGKQLFLITGAHADFANHTATYTIGKNWKEYFDIVITYAKKPGFFIQERDFIGLNDKFQETDPIATKDLHRGGMYTYGNWIGLRDFLTQLSNKTDPKFLYIGDNLIQDIYVPHVHTECDTVNVCEELEAESSFGFTNQEHPDKHVLSSTLWGSYFHCKDTGNITVWYNLMRRHSLICVPSLEYIAKYPVDYQFELSNP